MVEGPVTNRRVSRRVMRQVIIISAVLSAVLISVTGGWYFYSSHSQSVRESSRHQLETDAKQLAGVIADNFNNIAVDLKKLSREQSIIAIFEQADPDTLAQKSDAYQNRFEAAIKLRLLLPGVYETDSISGSPLSFASLDLLRQAEQTSSPISAEVHLFGSPQQHIVMIQRVNNKGGELIGLLHLSLDVVLFEKVMAGLNVENAYVELRQSASGTPLTLASRGNPDQRSGDPIITAVNGTKWSLAYWQGSGLTGPVDGSVSGLPAIITFTILALLFIAIGVMIYLRLRPHAQPGIQKSTGVIYTGAVQAIMEGVHPGMEKLVPNLPSFGQKKPIQALSPGMVGDDITMIMKQEDLIAEAAKQEEVFDITGSQPETPVSTAENINEQQPAVEHEPTMENKGNEISSSIFRAYDIRGIVGKTLTADIVTKIGQAIGSEAGTRGLQSVVVGRDGRASGTELGDALIEGLRSAGRNVIDIGMVPTPVLYFATHFLDATSGVMLTGSHNGPEYNGMKIVLGGETLSEDAIKGIYNRIMEGDLETGHGELQSADIIADYIRRIAEDIPVALGGAFKIVIDCGNGVAGLVAPQLIRALGHDVIELFCDVDGQFPNHHPDPSQPENLQMLISKVKEEQADLGLAFDGDGDRLGFIDSEGNIIWPDRQLMLLARDVLTRNQGAQIIFDVKCSRYLRSIIESCGGKPLMWKTGHSLIKAKMKEVDAPLAGEMSGHIFFKERWYGFDDALYTAARLLEVLVNSKMKTSEAFAELPAGVSTPELRLDLSEEAHQSFMQNIREKMSFGEAEVIDLDGFRVEFPDGWGLIRPSNTTPCLVLRFEAESKEALARIQGEFRSLLLNIDPALKIPF